MCCQFVANVLLMWATRAADGRQMETLNKDDKNNNNKDDGRREAEMLRRIMADVLRATKVGTQF